MVTGAAGWGSTNLGGGASNNGLASLGDLNGDGIDDFVALQNGSGGSAALGRGAYVLYGPISNPAPVDLTSLPPSQGYRIRPAVTSANPRGTFAVGDQNGDGLTDVLFAGPSAEGQSILYSVSDATELPACDGTPSPPASSPRCLDTADPVDEDGNRLGFAFTHPGLSNNTWSLYGPPAVGDLNGDGSDQIVLLAGIDSPIPGVDNALLVVGNGLGDLCDDEIPGLCTVDLDTLSAPDVVAITLPDDKYPGGWFNGDRNVLVIDDRNGDGRDELVTFGVTFDASQQLTVEFLYGQDWQEDVVPIEAGRPGTGYSILGGFQYLQSDQFQVGDVNGDGKEDFGIFQVGLAGSQMTIWTGDAPAAGETVSNPGASGYTYDISSSVLTTGRGVTLGDINGDGADDFVLSRELFADPVLGSNTGHAVIYFGKKEKPSAPIPVGLDGESQAEDMVRIVGPVSGGRFGRVTATGDQDGDGIADLIVSSQATNHGQANQGDVRIIPGRSLFGAATTGFAGSVTDQGATLGGTARANGRASTAWFEYGATTSYGSQTGAQDIGKTNAAKFIEAELAGLTPETTYHYRTVLKNDLGLQVYGPDRTFTTRAADGGSTNPCEANPTAPGCGDYCAANPTAPGCIEPKARLGGLIANSSSGKVRRGGKLTVKSWVTNTGNADATGVKLCVNVPKRLVAVNGKRCRGIGKLASGATARVQFKLKVKAKARKGAKPTVKVVASASDLTKKTAKARFRVR